MSGLSNQGVLQNRFLAVQRITPSRVSDVGVKYECPLPAGLIAKQTRNKALELIDSARKKN